MEIRRITRTERRLKALVAVSLVTALAFGGTTILSETIDIEQGKKQYDAIASQNNLETFQNVSDMLLEQNPEYNFDELSSKYPDIVGYISGSCLPQSYPVVKDSILATDAYYADHLPDGTPSSIGSICFNEDNNFDLVDDFSVMYAHNINGAMFGDLSNYADSDYMNDEENYFIYHTKNGKYKLEPFAYYTSDNVPYGKYSDEEKQVMINNLKGNNIVNSDIDVTVDDNIVTLFTCLEGTDPNYWIHPELRVMVACKVTPLVLYNNIDYTNAK